MRYMWNANTSCGSTIGSHCGNAEEIVSGFERPVRGVGNDRFRMSVGNTECRMVERCLFVDDAVIGQGFSDKCRDGVDVATADLPGQRRPFGLAGEDPGIGDGGGRGERRKRGDEDRRQPLGPDRHGFRNCARRGRRGS